MRIRIRSPIGWYVFPLLIVLVDSPPVFGEGSDATLSVSYTVLHDDDSAFTYGRGLSLAGTCRVRGWLSAAAEGAFSAHREDYSSSQGGTYDFRYQSLQAGPRLSLLSGRVRPYADLLAGVTRQGIWERRLDNIGEWGSPQLSIQPGLGVDLLVTKRVALRLGGDLRLLFRHDNRFDRNYRTRLYRFNVGLALHLGDS